MGNPEFLRGCGVGRQSAAGSAAVPNWLHYQTKFEITDEVKYDIPHFLNYRLWLESQATATTRVGMAEFEMRLDPWEVGWFLVSMCGAPASGVFLGGASAAPLLTFVKVNNLSTYRQMTDSVVSDMDFDMDATSG